MAGQGYLSTEISAAPELPHNSVLVTKVYKSIHAGDELPDIDHHNELGFLSPSH